MNTHKSEKRDEFERNMLFFFFIVKRILKFFAFYIFLKIIEKIFEKKNEHKKINENS